MSLRALVFVAAVVVGVSLRTNSWWAGGFFGALTFVGSAYLHPYVRCGTCKGAGRHRGGIFNYAMRPCHACSGAGQQQRLTAQMLGRGRPKVAGSRIAPATKSFGKS